LRGGGKKRRGSSANPTKLPRPVDREKGKRGGDLKKGKKEKGEEGHSKPDSLPTNARKKKSKKRKRRGREEGTSLSLPALSPPSLSGWKGKKG